MDTTTNPGVTPDPAAIDAIVAGLFYDYAEHADRGDVVAFADLFTNDCRFDRGRAIPHRSVIERNARRLLGAFSATSHQITAVRVRSFDGTVATATAYVHAWHRRLDGETFEAYAHYEVAVRHDDERWRFCEHTKVIHGLVGTDGEDYIWLPRADLSGAS